MVDWCDLDADQFTTIRDKHYEKYYENYTMLCGRIQRLNAELEQWKPKVTIGIGGADQLHITLRLSHYTWHEFRAGSMKMRTNIVRCMLNDLLRKSA